MKKPDLSHIPAAPGVYFMKNNSGDILYIGKSNKLTSRVSSYFRENADLNFAKKKMIQQVGQVDYLETTSDLEALMLETNLIKKHRPKYNILMKDDKNLSYLKITTGDIPRLITTRQKTQNGIYFGPYSQYTDARRLLRTLSRIFCLGNHRILKKKDEPCMDSYIGLCPGHCSGEEEKIKQYLHNLTKCKNFLQGEYGTVFSDLEKKMMSHASEMEFEQAGELKSDIETLKSIQEKQMVRNSIKKDTDIITHIEKYDTFFIGLTQVRDGMVLGTQRYTFKHEKDTVIKDIYETFLLQNYIDNNSQLDLSLGEKIEISKNISEFLKEKQITYEVATRGEKMRIAEFTKNDLFNYAHKAQMSKITNLTLSKKHMYSILEKLEYKIDKKKKEILFECYDISHHQGEHTVASQVVINNGKPDTAKYKKYKIKTLKHDTMIDDFASMREVLSRRTRRACETKDIFPDMIVIDGGKGQLSSAVTSIETIYNAFQDSKNKPHKKIAEIVAICSLAKREEEVFVPGKTEPILFEKGSPELMVLQKARDESHRFAISFNRSKREKSYQKNILEQVPGIGPKTRKKLISTFGSPDNLSEISQEQLEAHISKKQIQTLREYGIIK